MFKAILAILLTSVSAHADAPVVWGGGSAIWLPSSLKSVGVCKLNSSGVMTSLAPGASGNVLTSNGSDWVSSTPTNTGTVTSVALSDGSTTPIYIISGSPVTTSGTLTQTLNSQSANTIFAGPTSGGSAQPTFRSLVAADIPSLSASYATTTLNNLGTTSINSDLLPSATTTKNIGSSSLPFKDIHVGEFIQSSYSAAFTGTTTSGSSVITSVTPDPTTTGIWVGMSIGGTNIPPNAFVSAFTSTTISFSANGFSGVTTTATGSGTGTVTIYSAMVARSLIQAGAVDTGGAYFKSSNSGGGNTGFAQFMSGNTSGSGQSGFTQYGSGSSVNGQSGGVLIKSGNTTGTGVSGDLKINTGNNSSATSGTITISSGNVSGGTGNSGALNLLTGTSAGGTRGFINISGNTISANQFCKTDSSQNLITGTVNTTDLVTSVSGLLKGNGSGVVVATSGADYQAPISTDAAVTNQFLTGFTAPNTFTRAQPSFSNISGTATVAQGGTGQTSYTDGQLLIGNSTGNTLTKSTLTAGSGITITNGSGSITIAATGGGTTGITAHAHIDGLVVPYVGFDSHIQTSTQTLSSINIGALNSGTSGSTTVQVNQYRSGSLVASATATLSASSGAPSAVVGASLSASLSLLSGDLVSFDINSAAANASDLTIEY